MELRSQKLSLNFGYKQISPKFCNYHPDYVRKIIKFLITSGKLRLKHWLGPGCTMVMEDEEIETAKEKMRNIRLYPDLSAQEFCFTSNAHLNLAEDGQQEMPLPKGSQP